jgi:hypothetical protein
VLAVAPGHGDDLGAYRHELATRRLLTTAALLADAERDLVAGATVIARPFEHVASHCEQRCVIVQ